jgi:PEP-CTERM motif-containing protein
MRTAALLVSLILFPASRLFAGPIVFMEFLNSNFTFGTVSPNQEGHDLSSLYVDSLGFPVVLGDGAYAASGAALDSQDLDVSNGNIIGSDYFYTGGLFEILLSVEKNGQQVAGSFAAPIKKLAVTAGEADGDSVTALYDLGPGLFDAAIAEALGIGQHTTGGEAVSRLILTNRGNRAGIAGDHTTPERQAWDGVNHITLQVPEPATLALFAAAAALSIRRRPRR